MWLVSADSKRFKTAWMLLEGVAASRMVRGPSHVPNGTVASLRFRVARLVDVSQSNNDTKY
jgi:hypothetical protein